MEATIFYVVRIKAPTVGIFSNTMMTCEKVREYEEKERKIFKVNIAKPKYRKVGVCGNF